MLITITREFEDVRVLTILKSIKHVLAISKKPVFRGPCLCTKASEGPPVFILDHEYSIFVVSAVRIECDETTPILIHFVNSFPITSPKKRGQTADQVRYLIVIEYLTGLLSSWLVLQNLFLFWYVYNRTSHFVDNFILILLSFFKALNDIVV